MRLCRNSKRGSYIMEAAIVLPVIILVVITSNLIIMFFYSQMTERCRMHMMLRAEAGKIAGQTIYEEEISENGKEGTYVDVDALGGAVYGRKHLVMADKGVLDKKGVFKVEGKCFIVDGTDYIRHRMSAGDMIDVQRENDQGTNQR